MDPFGSAVIHLCSVNSRQLRLCIDYQLRGGAEGRRTGLLFPPLKKDCQLNNAPQLKSQYVSWSFLQLLEYSMKRGQKFSLRRRCRQAVKRWFCIGHAANIKQGELMAIGSRQHGGKGQQKGQRSGCTFTPPMIAHHDELSLPDKVE